MLNVRLFHRKAEEAQAVIEELESAGYRTEYTEKWEKPRPPLPDAFVIDLSRVPSHGREAAIFLRGSKATRHVPIVFVGGDPEKVKAIRQQLPDAVYTEPGRLRSAVRAAIANRPDAPVVPPQMMDRYGSRTAAQKLGIRAGSRVLVVNPPRDYAQAIGAVPPGVTFEEETRQGGDLTLWFVENAGDLLATMRRMRGVAAHSRLWVLWRKGRKSEVTQTVIREAGLGAGLVDYKICAVNETWSAMAFAPRKHVQRAGAGK